VYSFQNDAFIHCTYPIFSFNGINAVSEKITVLFHFFSKIFFLVKTDKNISCIQTEKAALLRAAFSVIRDKMLN